MMTNNKFIRILFFISSLIISGIGLGVSIIYFRNYFIVKTNVLDDLQSGIITSCFIFPLGLYIFYLSLGFNSKLSIKKKYGDLRICIPCLLLTLTGLISTLIVSIKFDLTYLFASFIFLLLIFVVIFLIYFDSKHPGFVHKKSKRFYSCTYNQHFYIDGIDIYDEGNYKKEIDKKVKLFFRKKFVGISDKVILIQGTTKKFYITIYHYDENYDLIYFLNLKTALKFAISKQEDTQKNYDENYNYIVSLIQNDFIIKDCLAFKIITINDVYKVEVYLIFNLPQLDLNLKINPTLKMYQSEIEHNNIEEANQEIDQLYDEIKYGSRYDSK